jgi:hypothetical protein
VVGGSIGGRQVKVDEDDMHTFAATDLDSDTESGGIPRILADLADGRLGEADTEAVLTMLRADAVEPPPWLVNRAVRIARPAEREPGRPAEWRRLIASLVYDNRLQARLTGARAVGAEQPRLMYQAGGMEIDLELGESTIAGRLRMLGQVTADESDVTRAGVIADGPSGRFETEVDDLGQFVLDGLVGGHHRMEIGLTYELIEIPDVQL